MKKTPVVPASTASTAPLPVKVRLAMIDVGKGLGILLIVIGHNAIFSASYSEAGDFLKTFRLPFFFFISGTTFAIGMRSVKEIAWLRADAWLKPCAVVVIVIGLLQVLLGLGTMDTIFLGLLYGTGFTLTWTPTWFLPHLWLLYVSTAIFLTYGRPLTSTWPRRIVLLLFMSVAGYLVMQGFDSGMENPVCLRIVEFGPALFDCGLPFSADILLLTGVFFLLGHFLSSNVKAFHLNWLLLGLAFSAMLALHYYFGFTIDFNQRRYDSLFVSTLQALCGIYVMLSVCSLLNRSAVVSRVLSYLGRGSLFILIFHAWIMLKLDTLLPRWLNNGFLVAGISITTAIIVPLIFWELAKRNKAVSLLMLPRKRVACPSSAVLAKTAN